VKKVLYILVTIIIASGLLISGCSKESSTSSPTTTAPPSTSTTKPAEPQPVYGGTFTIIENILASNVGYPPEFGSQEGATSTIWAEPLALLADDMEGLIPFLAESWDEDTTAKTLTIHLRKGIKFHDGTTFDAKAAKWNYQLGIDNKRFSLAPKLISIDIVDDYTLKFNMNDYPYNTKNIILQVNFYSPTAIETNGKEWARDHAVATGPFKVVDFQRDVAITCEKFTDYWQKDKGYPYLDKVVFKRVGDALVAKAMMEAGEADSWEGMSDPTVTVEMATRGFKAYYSGRPVNALQWFLYPEVKPNSIFNDIKIRQAIAYALDKEGIAKAIGKGIYDPLNQLVYKGLYGYNPDYKGYPYDPSKAKQLLADAGYPTGFQTQLVHDAAMPDEAAAVQANLKAVGIDAKLVPLTEGAWFPALFGMGWDGLNLAFSGTGNDKYCIASFNEWLGPNRSLPFILRDWSPEVISLLEQGLHTYDLEARKAIAMKLMTTAAEQLNVIPVYQRPIAVLNQAWVHSKHPEEGGYGGGRHIYRVWMDKH
jgi:ABC-type transport system substrate-binding protein